MNCISCAQISWSWHQYFFSASGGFVCWGLSLIYIYSYYCTSKASFGFSKCLVCTRWAGRCTGRLCTWPGWGSPLLCWQRTGSSDRSFCPVGRSWCHQTHRAGHRTAGGESVDTKNPPMWTHRDTHTHTNIHPQNKWDAPQTQEKEGRKELVYLPSSACLQWNIDGGERGRLSGDTNVTSGQREAVDIQPLIHTPHALSFSLRLWVTFWRGKPVRTYETLEGIP